MISPYMYTTCNELLAGKIELEVAMNNLEKRLNSLGLEIKSSKSNIMVFNNKPDRDNKIRMRIKGERRQREIREISGSYFRQ